MKQCWACVLCVFFLSCHTLQVGKRESQIMQTPGTLRMKENIAQECEDQLKEARYWLTELLKPSSKRTLENTLTPYHEILIRLDNAASKSSLFSQVHPDETIRGQAEVCEQAISQFATELSLNKQVYDAIAQVESAGFDDLTKRFLDKTLQDFRRSGVNQDEKTRERIKTIQEELVKIGQDFSKNIREDKRFIVVKKEDLEGLPKDYIEAHKADDKGDIQITTDYPDYIPFMTYAKSNPKREALSKTYLQRGYPKNESILKSMLEKRAELAKLLGYASYADYVVENKMVKTPQVASELIEKVTRISKASADRDYATLLKVKKDLLDPAATQVFGFERTYLEEQYKKSHYAFDSQEVRKYFEFNQVRDGLLKVTGDLFGLRYVPVENMPVWHPSVSVYDVYEGPVLKGRIYLDLHPRDNKYKHAAQFTLRSGISNRQLPEGVLVCNFADPSVQKPALMGHDQVVTLFHEFGHLIHHILGGHQPYVRFSGTATEWDFVEAPSQLLEEWAWDPKVLASFAFHVENKKPIPANLVEKMRQADEFGKGLDARQQMFYARLSLDFHLKDPKSFEPVESMKALQAKYSYFPYVNDTYFIYSFGHLEGYTAMYYTYMWSKVIQKDLFTPFEKAGLMDKVWAERYKNYVLKPGGSKDAEVLVANFLGRPYSFDAFEQWLLK